MWDTLHSYLPYLLAGLGSFFIGLSKAGFGGGLGMMVTPICVVAFGPKAIGILLPLLCAGDIFSMYAYWKKWQIKNFWFLLPGIIVGVIIGAQLFGRFTADHLNLIIGLLAISFVAFQVGREYITSHAKAFIPSYKTGITYGIAAGLTSTFAHGAGPVVTMFLLPQKMTKEVYMGTTIFIFTFINAFKMPFFCIDQSMINLPIFAPHAIITLETLKIGLYCFPLVPLGVWAGIWLNRKFSEAQFVHIIYILTALAGADLVWHSHFWRWF
ncbi:MAG: sulfite exporter TauE/SafE family protein [Verrucomicrobia bacterium]|nr:sulfite exporter TauE/SafE family protein [Verrucomicrobiota bacterium]